MTPDDIDFSSRTITVRGKGNKERALRAKPPVLKALRLYLRQKPRHSVDVVWLSEEGHPLTLSGVKQAVTRVLRTTGIAGKKISPHTFRHSYANDFLDCGGDPLDLQYILGHNTLAMVAWYSRAHKARRALKSQDRPALLERLGIK